MSSDRLFVALSSAVVLPFAGSIVLSVVYPIERSFAGIMPLVVGSAAIFSVPAVPLLLWRFKAPQAASIQESRLSKVLFVGLLCPLVFFMAGILMSFLLMFRGR